MTIVDNFRLGRDAALLPLIKHRRQRKLRLMRIPIGLPSDLTCPFALPNKKNRLAASLPFISLGRRLNSFCNYAAVAAVAEWVDIEIHGGHIFVDTEIPGVPDRALIDRAIAKKEDWLERYPSIDGMAAGVDTQARTRRFNLPEMTFGVFEIENPIITIAEKGVDLAFLEGKTSIGSRIPKQRQAKGLLGYDILEQFVVTIDYKSGHVHIAPGQ